MRGTNTEQPPPRHKEAVLPNPLVSAGRRFGGFFGGGGGLGRQGPPGFCPDSHQDHFRCPSRPSGAGRWKLGLGEGHRHTWPRRPWRERGLAVVPGHRGAAPPGRGDRAPGVRFPRVAEFRDPEPQVPGLEHLAARPSPRRAGTPATRGRPFVPRLFTCKSPAASRGGEVFERG